MSLMQGMDEMKNIQNMQELCEAALEIFGNNQDAAFEWLCSPTPRRWAKFVGGGTIAAPRADVKSGAPVPPPRVSVAAVGGQPERRGFCQL